MSNITLETSTFGEQLGVYDFFNVLLSGACFLFSLLGIIYLLFPCVILSIFCDISFLGGIILAVIVFIVGLIIQEIGSIADRDIWHALGHNRINLPSTAVLQHPLVLNTLKVLRTATDINVYVI